MRRKMKVVAIGLVLLSSAGRLCHAAQPQASGGKAQPVVILDTSSSWRMHQALQPPVIQLDRDLKPIQVHWAWLNWSSPPAPAGWRQPAFDDSSWRWGPGKLMSRTPYLARLCLRGRFNVTEPEKVTGLTLSVGYHGGAIVYVNGQEIKRGHLPKGSAGLAEGYPPGAFVNNDGNIIPAAWWVPRKFPKNLALRKRAMTDISIPARALRKGVNVVAIDIIRAPYHKVVEEKKYTAKDVRDLAARGTPYDLTWNTCELLSVQLKADRAEGIIANVSRPAGLHVWNSDLLAADYSSDYGDRYQKLQPVVIKAARNGWFSGKVMVGSSKAMGALKVTPGDLKGTGTSIPASQVQVRYAASLRAGWTRFDSERKAHPRGAELLNVLLETPPTELAAAKPGSAVVPVWVTVRVAKEAKPGAYTGELIIEAADATPVKVPVKLHVSDYALPDTQDYRTWVDLIQSPDTLALEYGLEPWSDRHWEMIATSLRMIGRTGSRTLYVPLICHTNFGNAESMIRWIRKDEDRYECDFSIAERYVDMAVKHMGKPVFVVFVVWDAYLSAPKGEITSDLNAPPPSGGDYHKFWKYMWDARRALRGKGPAVTVVDQATNKAEVVYLPRYEDPAAKPLWQPLWAELRKRMEKRGLANAMALGILSDDQATKAEVVALHELSGGLPWVRHTHGGSHAAKTIHGTAKVAYVAYVWNQDFPAGPSKGSMFGWKKPELHAQFERFNALNGWPGCSIRNYAEINITGSQRGVGRVGADTWPVIKDKKGRRKGTVGDRYPQSRWRNLDLFSHFLVPGPTGPVAATRYELFREGLQECEARICLESALSDDALKAKLGPDLVRRAQECLDERLQYAWVGVSHLRLTGHNSYYFASRKKGSVGGLAGHFWFAGSGWQDRSEKLFNVAGEFQKLLGE